MSDQGRVAGITFSAHRETITEAVHLYNLLQALGNDKVKKMVLKA